MPPNITATVRSKIFTFGSYRMGEHTKGSDIDILCVAPRHVERSEFFISFVEIMREQKEVKDLCTIEDAYVPIIKMTFDDVPLDLLFARLAFKEIPENLDVRNRDVSLLKNLDPRCVRSINGCRMVDEILRLVPNQDSFKLALRPIKLWARKQGFYSNVLGYLGGVSWSILLARICQLYPNASAATLVHKFFYVFSQWNWPKPVFLKHQNENKLGMKVWNAQVNASDRSHLMPILTPVYPTQNSTYNVTYSTKTVMQDGFKRGLQIMNEVMTGKCCWNKLFEPIDFFTMYKNFILLTTAADTEKDHVEWYGLVRSKIRTCISNLEKHPNIDLVHVNPDTFTPIGKEPDSFQSMWFMGLQVLKTGPVRIDFTNDMQKFNDCIIWAARSTNVLRRGMKIDIKHVKRKDLTMYLPSSIIGKRERDKVNSNSMNSSDVSVKKRSLDESENTFQSKRRSFNSDCSPAWVAQRNMKLPLQENRGNDRIG